MRSTKEIRTILRSWCEYDRHKPQLSFEKLNRYELAECFQNMRFLLSIDKEFQEGLSSTGKEFANAVLTLTKPPIEHWTYSEERFNELADKIQMFTYPEAQSEHRPEPTIQRSEVPARTHVKGYKATWIEERLMEDLKKATGIETTSELIRVAILEKAERDLFRKSANGVSSVKQTE